MIRRTFLILPRVGRKAERSIWMEGIERWDDFLRSERVRGFSPERKRQCDSMISVAERFLRSGQTRYFTRILPGSEQWRMYECLERDVAYLDIETDGLSCDAEVTVVGIHRAGETRTLVKGIDLDSAALAEELGRCRMLVTYNGSSFDLPILQYHFPFAMPQVPHMDLRHACNRIGLKGGLKSVERALGIRRPSEVEFVTGEEAAYLWKMWRKRGSRNALSLLRRYNEEDTRNLESIARHAYEALSERTLSEVA